MPKTAQRIQKSFRFFKTTSDIYGPMRVRADGKSSSALFQILPYRAFRGMEHPRALPQAAGVYFEGRAAFNDSIKNRPQNGCCQCLYP